MYGLDDDEKTEDTKNIWLSQKALMNKFVNAAFMFSNEGMR